MDFISPALPQAQVKKSGNDLFLERFCPRDQIPILKAVFVRALIRYSVVFATACRGVALPSACGSVQAGISDREIGAPRHLTHRRER